MHPIRSIARISLMVAVTAAGLTAVTSSANAEEYIPLKAGAARDVDPQIVGGRPASQTYSFMVSLQSGGRHICGASLVKPQWIVTARHCVGSSGYTVRVGTTTWNSGGETANATTTARHPSNDIAILRLDRAVNAAPIPIAADSGAPGAATRLIGWGQTCPTPGCGGAPSMLQEIDVSVQSSGCTSGFDPRTELCLGGTPGAGACYGDSGGPSVRQIDGAWQLTGATSRAGQGQPTCGQAPAIYTSVTALRDWVEQNTGSRQASTHP